MPETTPRVLSTDPNAGRPVRGDGPRVLSTDPDAGRPLRVASKSAPIPHQAVGEGVLDFLQGALSEFTNQSHQKVGTEKAAMQAFMDAKSGDTTALQRDVRVTEDVAQAPESASGYAGTFVPMAAEIAIPSQMGARAVGRMIPSAARAGKNFQAVMGAAKDAPVDLSEVGNVALRISQLAEHGGSMPMAVRKLIAYATDPNKPAMNYAVSRDFASNISRLSADEMGRLTPAVAREVANLRVAINKANAAAAKQAGKGAEYKSAMREYARAMRVRDLVDSAVQGAKQNLPWATGVGAGFWLTNKLKNAIMGEQ